MRSDVGPTRSHTVAVISCSEVLAIITSAKGGDYAIGCVCLSVVLSFCEQDNSRTRLQISTKHGRQGQGFDPLEVVTFWC